MLTTIKRPSTTTALPPIDSERLRAAIANLPNEHVTSAQVGVNGWAGWWSGRAGVADIRTGRTVPANGRFRIGQTTEMFTATVVLQLVAEARLALCDTVQQHLPGLLPVGSPPITVGQLLDHTSGLPVSDADTDDPAWVIEHRSDEHTPQQIVRAARGRPMVFAPGTRQRPNRINYVITGLLIEKVSGHSFGHELRARILHPLRLHDTSLPHRGDTGIKGRHAHGYARVGGELVDITAQSPSGWSDTGMISTTTDLARFVFALLRGRLVPAAQLARMHAVPDVDGACFSAGLQRTELPGDITLWGKNGGVPGYSTSVAATRDARRILSVSLTTTGSADAAEAALQRVASAAFGPAH
jgi:D-alanyl-D-alanine carboxypeptidase